MADKIRDIKKFGGKITENPPASVKDAFKVFCQQEQTNGVITDVTSCLNLVIPFMNENVLSLFESDANPDIPAVTKAWLGRSSLQVLALNADSGVMEDSWMKELTNAIGQDSNLMDLMGNKDFIDDLWMWAAMEVPNNGK